MTMAALDAGCHVLCEKPLAMTVSEAEQMLKKAEKKTSRVIDDSDAAGMFGIDMDNRKKRRKRTVDRKIVKKTLASIKRKK